jgi:hypothetical protein
MRSADSANPGAIAIRASRTVQPDNNAAIPDAATTNLCIDEAPSL